jgi:mannosyltransferase
MKPGTSLTDVGRPGHPPYVTNQAPFTRQQILMLLGLIVLACVLRFYQLGRESLWFDESLSALFATQPLGLSIRSMLEEGLHHSPLFYLLLRPFAAQGFGEFSLRFLPALLGILAVPLFAQLGRILASRRAGVLAATLVAINPFHVWYSRETRMYSLVCVAAVGAMYFFFKNVSQQPKLRNWIGLSLFTAIGITTHHFSFFIPLVQFIYILITFEQNHSLLRKWVAAQMLAAFSLVPWLFIVLGWGQFYGASAAGEYRPTVVDLAETVWNFSIGYTAQVTPFVILIVGIILATVCAGIRHSTKARALLLTWALVPPLITFGLSSQVPMYVDRYLMVAFPAFLLLVAIGITSMRFHTLRLAVSALILSAMLGGLVHLYYDRNVYDRADWRGLGAYLDESVTPATDTITTLYYQNLVPLHFYYHGTIPIEPVISTTPTRLPELPISNSDQRTFLIIEHPNLSVHLAGHCQAFDIDQATSNTEIKDWRRQNQDRLREVKEFTCIRVEVYE